MILNLSVILRSTAGIWCSTHAGYTPLQSPVLGRKYRGIASFSFILWRFGKCLLLTFQIVYIWQHINKMKQNETNTCCSSPGNGSASAATGGAVMVLGKGLVSTCHIWMICCKNFILGSCNYKILYINRLEFVIFGGICICVQRTHTTVHAASAHSIKSISHPTRLQHGTSATILAPSRRVGSHKWALSEWF